MRTLACRTSVTLASSAMVHEIDAGVVPKHLAERLAILAKLPIGEPPQPWRKASATAVGGLEAVGFADGSDLMLVLSSAGRSVIDCVSGDVIARDREPCELDYGTLLCAGIGPLAEDQVRMGGLYGGGLPNSTKDGWGVELRPLSWPLEELILSPPGETMLWTAPGKKPGLTKLQQAGAELRAFGFSSTGRSLVLACSSDVTVYVR